MPKFVSGSSGSVYSGNKDKSSYDNKDEDELLAVISNKSTDQVIDGKNKPSAINKKGTKEKQKTSLDLFKEELRRLNEERDEQRNKLKSSSDELSTSTQAGSKSAQTKQQPVPLPLRPDPRCPTTLTLQVNLNPKEKDGPSMGSFDTGDPTTTNLYVGNLNPIVTENDLCDIFGKFGPLASIKIMWPRTDEERARNRNSGFVAYMSRVDADRALKTLAGLELKGYEMKLGWSKAVPLPQDPVFIPKELQELLRPPPQSGMPFNAQLHKSDLERGYKVPIPHPRPPRPPTSTAGSNESQSDETYREFAEVLERSTVYVHVPKDRQTLDLIHKTIEHCLREGPVFEAIIIARESKNPKYKFLYENQSLEHIYYRWKLYSLLHGEDPHHWHVEPFKMFQGGPWWQPPPLNPFADGMPLELVEKLSGVSREILAGGRVGRDCWRKLEIFSEPSSTAPSGSELRFRGKFDEMKVQTLNQMLNRLMPTKASVGSAMLFCINHSDAAEEIIKNVEQAIGCESQAPVSGQSISNRIALLFLISDILHNSSAAVTNASFYRKGFQIKLSAIFGQLKDFLGKIEDQQQADKFKRRAMSVLSSWNYFHIYESKFLVELSDILLGPSSRPRELRLEVDPAFHQSPSEEPRGPEQQTEMAELDDHLDGEAIEDDTLAECLEARGLSLRWYKTLDLSDDDEQEGEPAERTNQVVEDRERASSSKLADGSTPSVCEGRPEVERVKFKASKWELVNRDEEEAPKSPSNRIDPIRTLTTSELLLRQQMQRQEVVSSADEYESLGSSDESRNDGNK